MSKRVLLTTTSFQDTPGSHQDLLNAQDWELVRERGPLSEARMLELSGDFDAFLCGDDALTPAVIDKCLPRLKWKSSRVCPSAHSMISRFGLVKGGGKLGRKEPKI